MLGLDSNFRAAMSLSGRGQIDSERRITRTYPLHSLRAGCPPFSSPLFPCPTRHRQKRRERTWYISTTLEFPSLSFPLKTGARVEPTIAWAFEIF